MGKQVSCNWTHISPPKGIIWWSKNWERLYKEAHGNGRDSVIHPDFPEWKITPNGGYSKISAKAG